MEIEFREYARDPLQRERILAVKIGVTAAALNAA